MTASAADEAARETPALGHGVFTFAFLDALVHADNDNDGLITANDLVRYIFTRVPLPGGHSPQVQMSFEAALFTRQLR